MSETLYEPITQIRSDLESFISNSEINEKTVDSYQAHVDFLHERKMEWALSKKYGTINSIRVYGSIRLLYEAVFLSKYQLLEAKRRGENPTTAKRLLPFFSDLVLFSRFLSNELEKDEKSIDFYSIEIKSRDIRSKADEQGLLLRKKYSGALMQEFELDVKRSISPED